MEKTRIRGVKEPQQDKFGMMSLAIEGYEDIHKEEPYVDAFFDGDVAYIDILYVPPFMRGRGVGIQLFNNWVSGLDSDIKRVKLMASTLGGSDGLLFWKKLGFKNSYVGEFLYNEIENAMGIGVNGYSDPIPELILKGDDYRHWIECEKDRLHFNKNPQKLIGK